MGMVSKMHCKIWQKDFAQLPIETTDAIFRDLELVFQWERTADTDKEMLMHMSSMHRSWRGVLKRRNYIGKSLEDALASVPSGVDPSDWQTMCERWNTSDDQSIADRNKVNRSRQVMPYRRGRTSHYQLKEDFRLTHDREANRLEIFKMGRCRDLPDGSDDWVDDESRSRYERMTQMMTQSLDGESGSTPISAEEAFISVMGKDRSGRVRCGGSRETLHTWYGPTVGSSSSAYQQKMKNMEDMLHTQVAEVEQLRTQVAEVEQLRTQVAEMRSQHIEVEQLHTQLAEMRSQHIEVDELRTQIEQMRRRENEMDEMRRHMSQMSAFMTKFDQGAAQDDDYEDDIDEAGDDYDD